MLPMVVQLLAEAHKAQHDQLALAAMQAAAGMGSSPSPTAGFLSNPGGSTGPMNAGSSPQRMQGDAAEMQHSVVHGGG